MTNYLDLTGRVALVTGGSSGIGAATAELLAELGAQVAVGYYHNEAGAQVVRDRIRDLGRQTLAIKADVRQAAEAARLVEEAAAELGPIDILVNNAGSLLERQTLLQITEARLNEIFALNVNSAVFVTQAAVPAMLERKRGAIVNVVSIAGHNGGGPGAGAYAAAKGALTTFTKSMAKELAPRGIRVNGLAPGVIDTPFHEAFSTAEMLRNFVAAIPLGRLGTSKECATAIAFLVSDAASYIVGETIEVNGGQLMR
jgi:3-oxoacyl-[acyl-carrier protein] reductase